MNILFLTNNPISYPLYEYISQRHNVTLFQDRIISPIENNIDLVISYNYKYIIKKNFLVENKFINLHISLLPWNKGANPNFWSIVNDTPKGVTIHMIDEGIDTGDILFQKEIFFDEELTLKTSYEVLHKEITNLFIDNIDSITKKDFNRIKQDPKKGDVYYIKDFNIIKHIIDDLGWNITIKELKARYKKYRTLLSEQKY